jgi:hypothetical protein
MTLKAPHPVELLRVAKKVAWYDSPERTLADLQIFLTQLMVYGSPADVAVVERYVPAEEFRKVLENAPAGVYTQDAWERWHRRFGLPVPPLPRRRFPDGSLGPEAGRFFGR